MAPKCSTQAAAGCKAMRPGTVGPTVHVHVIMYMYYSTFQPREYFAERIHVLVYMGLDYVPVVVTYDSLSLLWSGASSLATRAKTATFKMLKRRSEIARRFQSAASRIFDVHVTSALGHYAMDPVHGDKLPAVCRAAMDTVPFSACMVSWLGASFRVFRATHNRFQHSVGTAHLARQMVRNLRTEQPELPISDADEMCVTLALCHDLGHGPFRTLLSTLLMRAPAGNNDVERGS